MVIGIIGESCTGKSTLAKRVSESISCKVFAGKDYLRLAKNEAVAKEMFQQLLLSAVHGDNVIYIVSEKEHLSLLPEGALRILMTSDLDMIKERFAERMHGNLPAPVAAMLEKKHGCFDECPYDVHITEETDIQQALEEIWKYVAKI